MELSRMGILKLKGRTLGEKHQHYNKLLKEFTSTNVRQELGKIDYNEPDIDNLFKIDIASKQKNVDYILEVFKCEDMLYVSRALKQSVWLITDTSYEDIINPDYLNNQLLPQMTSKAGQKLILAIRLNLKDERRVELFCKYYEEKNELKTAWKWLPNCSISHIEKVVEKYATDIPNNVIKRLCEKSITVLEICTRKKHEYDIRMLLSETMFLLKNDAEKFISIISSREKYGLPMFNPKSTQIIMKTRPDIILDNFEKFAKKIHIPTFIKFLRREEIKDFLLKHVENNNLKSWFTFETMKHFIFQMPSEGRFDFVKRLCIDRCHDSSEQIAYGAENCSLYNKFVLCCTSKNVPQSSNAHIYKWYKFAPFCIAFTDLMKLIRVESSPSERNEIFAVLIASAKSDTQNLHTVLKYYRDKHMNEPFKFKSHFVNVVASQAILHKLDDKTWSVLNDIFCSMEVYSENDNNVQSSIKYIIVYKVVHDLAVPEIVENKFEFDTLRSFRNKLNNVEKNKLFDYLYQFITSKILNFKVNNESDLKTVIQHIVNALNLLNDWNKNILQYGIILEKIREVIKIKNNQSWNVNLSPIYNVNKSWRKHMFQESLFLHPTQETCINALKHGPEILKQFEKSICSNDSMILTRFLSKLRTYWHLTLATAFEDTFQNLLNNKTKHKMSARGLCILLPRKQLIDVLSKHAPNDVKINWAELDDFALSIQKCFAKYMLLARPHPPVDIILLYAKGDYLQFVLPSVHSILYNVSSEQSIKHMPRLLEAPVSLQKHGLKIAFTKLKLDELLQTFLNTWKSAKNPSIRATIFKLVFQLLCKEVNEQKIIKIWHILSNLIDSLTPDENRVIYVTLGKASEIPLPVKQAYCMKSYKYLRSLPPKANCDKFSESIIHSILDIMEFIDADFVVELLFDSFDDKFTKQNYNYINLISSFLLSTKSENVQTQRYEKTFVPLLQKYLSFIKDPQQKLFYVKYNFKNILYQLLEDFEHITIQKSMITPIKLFNDIRNDLENNFSNEDNYVMLMTWRLAAKYMQLIEKYRFKGVPDDSETGNNNDNAKRNILYLEANPEFGKLCMEQLQEEVNRYFPSVYRLFTKAVTELFHRFKFNSEIELATITTMHKHADTTEGHLLILKLFPNYPDNDKQKEEIRKMCEVLGSHPSPEVRMFYQHMLRKKERYEYLNN